LEKKNNHVKIISINIKEKNVFDTIDVDKENLNKCQKKNYTNLYKKDLGNVN